MSEPRTLAHADLELAVARDLLAAETARVEELEQQLDGYRGAVQAALLGWWEKLAAVQRQNADLQAANTALLRRARESEAAPLEAEAEIEARDERDADLALEFKEGF